MEANLEGNGNLDGSLDVNLDGNLQGNLETFHDSTSNDLMTVHCMVQVSQGKSKMEGNL